MPCLEHCSHSKTDCAELRLEKKKLHEGKVSLHGITQTRPIVKVGGRITHRKKPVITETPNRL